MNFLGFFRFREERQWCVQLVRVECVEDQQLERVHQEMLKQLLKVWCLFFCEDSALLVECKFVGVQARVCLCAFFLIGLNWHALSCPVCLFLVTKRCKRVL